MAGDWIKIREDLHEDPAVLKIASRLKTRPEHVAGYCLKFWSWVSRNCHAGCVTGVTLDDVEGVLALPHFLHLLREVGWLEYVESANGAEIRIPKFERHLSNTAKNRALAAERQRHARVTKTSRSKRDKSVTREEKSKRRSNTPPTPPAAQGGQGGDSEVWDNKAFADAWSAWCNHQRGLNRTITDANVQAIEAWAAEVGPAKLAGWIRQAIRENRLDIRRPPESPSNEREPVHDSIAAHKRRIAATRQLLARDNEIRRSR